jgi:hypothetical protein
MVPTCLIDRRWREVAAMVLDLAIPLGENPGIVRHSGSTAPMKGRQRRSASHVDDRGCVDVDAAEALAGRNVIEAADLTQNAVNDVVDTLADTTVFPTVFTDRNPLHVSALFGDNPLHRAIPEDARAEAEQIFDNLGDPRRRRRGADRRGAGRRRHAGSSA